MLFVTISLYTSPIHCQHYYKAIILVKILTVECPNTKQQSENIGNLVFYRDTNTRLKPTKDDPQGTGEFVNQSVLLLGE